MSESKIYKEKCKARGWMRKWGEEVCVLPSVVWFTTQT